MFEKYIRICFPRLSELISLSIQLFYVVKGNKLINDLMVL